MGRIFICPNNDLEAKTIIEMLEGNGEEYFVTGQAWGASWENLEPEIKEKIQEAKEEGKQVYGVELQGDSIGAINIDHHSYGEDDRSNPKSSIEQVSEILGVELTLDERFVAANDKGYIPAMEKLGAELDISSEDLKEIIANIRMRDRQMQGVTPEQEAQAQEAVEKLGEIEEKRAYIQLDLPHSKTSTVTDRLYGKYDNLLITSEDGETNFYGATEIINMLNEKFPGGWSGGQLDQGSGFWGGYADQEAIKEEVDKKIEEIKSKSQDKDKLKEFWLKKYSEDKIGTIAKLSQAMQHGAWLREWQRMHGDSPRIKPITKKVNGEKVKVGEADIAVPWSKLHTFFRQGNEYGDIETVKFLSERIENGDSSELTEKELYELSEKENVKWSDGKHSLNPFQGYLYDFVDKSNYILETPLGEADYGKLYPMIVYDEINTRVDLIENEMNKNKYSSNERKEFLEMEIRENRYQVLKEEGINKSDVRDPKLAFSRFYATRLLQEVLKDMKDSKYYDFVNFDVTSVIEPSQIEELDLTIIKILRDTEVKQKIESLRGNAKFEKDFYNSLRREIEIEIKKDSDRIENAYKVYMALETGDMDELLDDPETAKWAEEVYKEEIKRKDEQRIEE